MPLSSVHVLIVDDELPARQRLVDLLEERDDVTAIDTAKHGEEAVKYLQEQSPDIVFLDVQMPGETGLDVIRQVGPENMPATIFVTAYDRYALRAFELAALDYLLKPFDDERFEQAFERAIETIQLKEAGGLRDQLVAILENQEDDSPANPKPQSSLKRIAVESRGQRRIIPVSDITYISASGAYLELHTGEETHLLRERMKTLDEHLDPDEFYRIHRSTIVRLDCIESLLNQQNGGYRVRLKDGTVLPLSRRRREPLEKRLGLNF